MLVAPRRLTGCWRHCRWGPRSSGLAPRVRPAPALSHLSPSTQPTCPLPLQVRTSEFTSKLHLVDLAGSERVKRSGVTGKELKEATHINRCGGGGRGRGAWMVGGGWCRSWWLRAWVVCAWRVQVRSSRSQQVLVAVGPCRCTLLGHRHHLAPPVPMPTVLPMPMLMALFPALHLQRPAGAGQRDRGAGGGLGAGRQGGTGEKGAQARAVPRL